MIQSSDLVTIAMLVALEGLLSADNAMVLAVLVLGLPKAQQRKALRYGIAGAFVIIAWVGVKLLVEYLHTEGYVAFDIPKWLSLGLIVIIFAIALGYSLVAERRGQRS